MKKLLALLLLFGIVGCAVEKDTRLICDCDFVTRDYKKEMCYSDSYEVNNNSLVFNVSKKKFAWNGSDITLQPDEFLSFAEDKITYQFESYIEKVNKSFDKINLVYKSSYASTKTGDIADGFEPPVSRVYQCRIVEGV